MTLSELALEPFANVREYNGFLIQILTSRVVNPVLKCFSNPLGNQLIQVCKQRLR